MADGGITPERVVALRVLRRVDGGAWADRAFAGEARKAQLDARVRARAMRLTYGAVQRQRTLDWLIDRALDRPAALEPTVRDVLRLGAYELLFADGTPAHAAVDQSVRQARAQRSSGRRASARAGLVNAVLRRIDREGAAWLEELDRDGGRSAAIRHSIPDWIADRLIASLGEVDGLAVMAAANQPAESALRWNPLRGPRSRVEAALPSGWSADHVLARQAYLPGSGFALEDSDMWRRGYAMAQSRASQLVAEALAPQAGEAIIDLTAAPGAKTTHVAALAHGGARITAVELHPSRAKALAATCRRMGARVDVVVGDALSVPLPGNVDAVLVDPPCTGTGVLASRPDARWRRRQEALPALEELQRALLARAWELVRPGGRIIYSTCSLFDAENEAIIAPYGAHLTNLAERFPTVAHPRLAGALLTLPHRHHTDGFFIAELVKGNPA